MEQWEIGPTGLHLCDMYVIRNSSQSLNCGLTVFISVVGLLEYAGERGISRWINYLKPLSNLRREQMWIVDGIHLGESTGPVQTSCSCQLDYYTTVLHLNPHRELNLLSADATLSEPHYHELLRNFRILIRWESWLDHNLAQRVPHSHPVDLWTLFKFLSEVLYKKKIFCTCHTLALQPNCVIFDPHCRIRPSASSDDNTGELVPSSSSPSSRG